VTFIPRSDLFFVVLKSLQFSLTFYLSIPFTAPPTSPILFIHSSPNHFYPAFPFKHVSFLQSYLLSDYSLLDRSVPYVAACSVLSLMNCSVLSVVNCSVLYVAVCSILSLMNCSVLSVVNCSVLCVAVCSILSLMNCSVLS
jgi:hypothetical protein